MMIPKEQLTGEDVRQVVEQMIRDHLNVAVDGYNVDTTVVVNGLVKAAIEGQTIESGCEDLALEVGSNTVREHLNALLDGYDLRQHEGAMNAGWRELLPIRVFRTT